MRNNDDVQVNMATAISKIASIEAYVICIYDRMYMGLSPLEQEITDTVRRLNYTSTMKELIVENDEAVTKKLLADFSGQISELESKLADLKSQRPLKESDKEA